MKSTEKMDDHHCSVIEKKRLEFDMAYCDATYDSKEGRDRCYNEAKESSRKREYACKYS